MVIILAENQRGDLLKVAFGLDLNQ